MLKQALRFVNEDIMFPRRYAFLAEELSPFLQGVNSILDVGSSNGRLITKIAEGLGEVRISGVDINVQPNSVIPIQAYDGKVLPFENGAFECVVLIDVLHHADDPVALLKEASRVARNNVLIKDHYWNNQLDWFVLKWADYFGNDPLGITLPYNYLNIDAWHRAFATANLDILIEKPFMKLSYDPCKHIIYHLAKKTALA